MIKNYLTTAFRFLKKNKLFTAITTIGLSVALSASFIILLYIINELSYDHCHKNRARVYRVVNSNGDFNTYVSATPYNLAQALKDNFPQIEKTVRVMPIPVTLKPYKGTIPEIAISSESDIFNMFTFPDLKGDIENKLLEDKNSIVLSDRLAKRIFGNQEAVGKEVLAAINDEDHLFIVKGVFSELPENSTFQTQCLISDKWSVEYVKKKFNKTEAEVSSAGDLWVTWVLTSKGADVAKLKKMIRSFSFEGPSGQRNNIFSLQNLSNVYLGSDQILNSGIRGSISSIRIFSALAFLIIVVAAINYIILSMAISSGRSREIGIRKTFGAGIEEIKFQFLNESLLLSCFVLPAALILTYFFLPVAGKIFHVKLQLIMTNGIIYITSCVALVIIIGILSGFYTSQFLSRLNILDILNNKYHIGRRNLILRSGMIVLQLVIFCSFMSAALIIRSQYKFEINKDLGYYNKDILLIDLGPDFKDFSLYLDIIKSKPDVINASGTNVSLPLTQTKVAFAIPGFKNQDAKVTLEILNVDFDFIKTMGMTIVDGRDFSKEFGSDIGGSLILNETAIKKLEITDPVGKELLGQKIIGVVKDFNLFSLHSDITPLTMSIFGKVKNQIVVHYKHDKLKSVLPDLENEWKKISAGKSFQYKEIETVIGSLYSTEKNLSIIVTVFAVLTLLITSSGLFGLTLFLLGSRTREIGIKKVFGSTCREIIQNFLWENIILAFIAALLSAPITIQILIKWLNSFPYKVNVEWGVFLITALFSAAVVLITVYYHSFKASRINPVDTLKYE
jgi:putative ABC transport system permease protein